VTDKPSLTKIQHFAKAGIVDRVSEPFALIEFPADDADRARRFWSTLLEVELAERSSGQGAGWQVSNGEVAIGVHERGRGPGDTGSLPYFTVGDLDEALERVTQLGGSVIHPGAQWAICRDCEGTPFGLALQTQPG
jgi:predicted enzyme related to lactoylglutathione lyase